MSDWANSGIRTYYEFNRNADQKIGRVSGYENRIDETEGNSYFIRCTVQYGLSDRKGPGHISFHRICQCCVGHFNW